MLALAGAIAGLPPGRADAATVSVQDDDRRVVTLAAPARRIVSLSPAATESLFAVGAGAQIVGTSAYSDYPAAARRVPRIGDAYAVDREALVRLAPDLAIVWGSGTPARRVAEIRALGIPVYVTEPRSTADIAHTLERLGTLTGHEDQARAAVRAWNARIAALRAQYAGRPHVDVFVQISATPLMTINGKHALSEALALCGARNVFADLTPLAGQVAHEAVFARDPQLVIAVEPPEATAAALAPWRRFSSMRAVRANGLAGLSPDLLSRAAPSFADGIAALCEQVELARARSAAR